MIVEYDCWKCGVWHEATLESDTDLTSFVSAIGASVRNAETKELIIEGKNNA